MMTNAIAPIIREKFFKSGTLSLVGKLGCVVPASFREPGSKKELSDFLFDKFEATHFELIPEGRKIKVNVYRAEAFGATEVNMSHLVHSFTVPMFK